MKILQLGKFYPIRGGVEKVMFDLTRGLSGAGYSCDMLCAAFQKERIVSIPLNGKGRVICAKALTQKAGTMIAPQMIRYLRRHRKEYDIIHVHHPDPMAALALFLSGYKGHVLLHWHSDIVSQKLLLACYKPLQNWLLRRASKVIGTTPVYVRDSPHLKRVQDKCTYVPIGIEPLAPDPVKTLELRQQYPGNILILSIGRLVPYKGYPYLIEAMMFLPPQYHLLLGGTGPLEGQLRDLVERLGLKRKVTLCGYLPDEDIPSYFAGCDVFVLPSVIKTEAFGIVQIEAMSCGKPVVATRIPASGVSWVNQEGVSGTNVPRENPLALANGIEQAVSKAAQYGEGARRLFQERYTLESMINKTIQIYENCNQ